MVDSCLWEWIKRKALLLLSGRDGGMNMLSQFKDTKLSDVINTSMKNSLSLGKYTRWLQDYDLTAEHLCNILKMLKLASDHTDDEAVLLRDPISICRNGMRKDPRAMLALSRLLLLVRNGVAPPDDPAFGLTAVSTLLLIRQVNGETGTDPERGLTLFTPEFANFLETDPEMAWLAAFDERSINTLLWDIGEFACRHYPGWQLPPFSDDESRNEIASQAVEVIAQIYHGEFQQEKDF